jgi:hypothetical protein
MKRPSKRPQTNRELLRGNMPQAKFDQLLQDMEQEYNITLPQDYEAPNRND